MKRRCSHLGQGGSFSKETDAAGAVVGVVVEPDRLLHKLDREPEPIHSCNREETLSTRPSVRPTKQPEPRGVADDEVDSAGLQRGWAPEVHLSECRGESGDHSNKAVAVLLA